MKSRFLPKRYASVLLLSLITVCGASSCARQIGANVYSGASVGEASSTFPGVVISSRNVLVQDKEYLEENGLGIAAGGIGGALLGSQVGKGRGNTVATIGGAALGAVGGAFAEKALKEQNGVEYVVALDNGEAKTVVQGPDPVLSPGQKVWVIVSHKGRSRVVARQ